MLGDFDKHFSIVLANTPSLLEKSYKLRYRVFCREKKIIIPSSLTKAEIEYDQYDEHYCIHKLLFYKPTKKYVGTARIILGSLLKEKNFPIEEAAKNHFYDYVPYHKLDKNHLAEFSRLAILPEFRPKLAVLGMMRAILQSCIKHNIYYFYAAIEPRVQRILERIGIHLMQISPIVTYHNERKCFLGFVEDILQTTYTDHPAIWEVLTNNGKLRTQHILDDRRSSDNPEDQLFNYI